MGSESGTRCSRIASITSNRGGGAHDRLDAMNTGRAVATWFDSNVPYPNSSQDTPRTTGGWEHCPDIPRLRRRDRVQRGPLRCQRNRIGSNTVVISVLRAITLAAATLLLSACASPSAAPQASTAPTSSETAVPATGLALASMAMFGDDGWAVTYDLAGPIANLLRTGDVNSAAFIAGDCITAAAQFGA